MSSSSPRTRNGSHEGGMGADGARSEPLADAARPRGGHGERINGSGRLRPRRPTVAEIVGARPHADLGDLYQFWGGARAEPIPANEEDVRARVLSWMSDPELVEERIESLGRRLGGIVEILIRSPRYELSLPELADTKALSFLSPYDLEASLATLERRALVVEGVDSRFGTSGERVFALPRDVAESIVRRRRSRERRVFEVLTLRGFLEKLYAEPERAARTTPARLREMYKMYASETAAVARIDRLPDGIRHLVGKAILEFGGVLPRGLFERMKTELPHWNGRRWRMILEQSLVGTVQPLELSNYGIQHNDETLVVFTEVALAWFRRVAVPGDPDRPHEECAGGIDTISNLSRFLGFILENDVRITVHGGIFKTTEKKILQHLIPPPGREYTAEEQLRFLFSYARHADLVQRTGERTLAVTTKGREWSQLSLQDKLRTLLDFVLEERGLGGEYYHQVRMRRILVRFLKRVEPDTWYDIMYLPFIARNNYLSNLDDLAVDEYFSQRSQAADYCPLEDPQRLAWNLVRWVRQRLYMLGFVDLGYDSSNRPVAMRLTQAGARALGLHTEPGRQEGSVGTLVVTPDFEVVLFPTGDDADLVHDLDRFCVREKMENLLHFRITEEAVRRALTDGMKLAHILGTLETHSRTPVPQNVRFSIRDWALRAGLMTLDARLVLSCRDPETFRAFQQDPGGRPHIARILDETRIQLKGRYSPKRMHSLLRDLGFLVELA